MSDKSIPDGRPRGEGFTLTTLQDDGASDARPIAEGGVIGRRVVAYLIDVAILSGAAVLAFALNIASLFTLAPLMALVITLLPLVYHTGLIAAEGSATIGMRVLGIRVVAAVGGAGPSLPQAFVLTALFYMTLYVTGGLLLLWCLFDDKQRCLHDILSNTRVVRVKRPPA